MRIVTRLRDNPVLRESFFQLARQVFDLDFSPWYQGGWWGEDYQPMALVEGDRVLANVSSTPLCFCWEGRTLRFVQLGTVMTHPDFRGQGFARLLMTETLRRWEGRCDGFYLYAHEGVADFYPKFGFHPGRETGFQLRVLPPMDGYRQGEALPIRPDTPGGENILRRCWEKGNSFSALTADNWGLVMFYCHRMLRDAVWYLPRHDAVVILEQPPEGPLCWDVFGGEGAPLRQLLTPLVSGKVRLGFTPLPGCGAMEAPPPDDAFFFVRDGCRSFFEEQKAAFPLLSHT